MHKQLIKLHCCNTQLIPLNYLALCQHGNAFLIFPLPADRVVTLHSMFNVQSEKYEVQHSRKATKFSYRAYCTATAVKDK